MFVEITNAPIFVKKTGQGEDALLLHGVPDSAEIWNALTELVKGHYTCYAPDLPGFYRSGMPENFQFNLNHYADYIDDLVTKLQLKTPLTLIAHDWGGIFGMLWACKYPHKVKKFVGGDFPFSSSYKWHEWATIWRTPLIGELSMALMNWPLFKWELQRSSRRLSVEDMWLSYKGRVTRRSTRKVVLSLYRSADPNRIHDWSDRQKNFAKKVPIDLLWGEDDLYVSYQEADLMHPRSVTVIPHCGHWVPQEAPEAYAKILLQT